jgi:hypothetical protein
MKIKNQSKRLIVLNYLENGKTRKSLPIGAGCEIENEHISKSDIAFYVGKKSIVILDDTAGGKDKKVEPIILPELLTVESLKENLTVVELKQYCKENKIKGVTGKNETELAEMILESKGITIEDDTTTTTETNEDENKSSDDTGSQE